MTEHKQVFIQVGEREAYVDEGIAPLIEEIWRANILTVMSCQHNNDMVWVCFAGELNARAFLTIVAGPMESGKGDSLYYRILSQRREETTVDWEYGVVPDDLALSAITDEEGNTIEEYLTGEPDFVFDFSVRFPHSDLPRVMWRIKLYNETKENPESSTRALERAYVEAIETYARQSGEPSPFEGSPHLS